MIGEQALRMLDELSNELGAPGLARHAVLALTARLSARLDQLSAAEGSTQAVGGVDALASLHLECSALTLSAVRLAARVARRHALRELVSPLLNALKRCLKEPLFDPKAADGFKPSSNKSPASPPPHAHATPGGFGSAATAATSGALTHLLHTRQRSSSSDDAAQPVVSHAPASQPVLAQVAFKSSLSSCAVLAALGLTSLVRQLGIDSVPYLRCAQQSLAAWLERLERYGAPAASQAAACYGEFCGVVAAVLRGEPGPVPSAASGRVLAGDEGVNAQGVRPGVVPR